MELVYLWVEDYKNIKNQGFNFSPRFRCEFKAVYKKDESGNEVLDEEKSELIICDKKDPNCKNIEKCKNFCNEPYLEKFFGENINITAIVGKNGSGKSSVLELLLELNGWVSTELKLFCIILDKGGLKLFYLNIEEVVFQHVNIMLKQKELRRAIGEKGVVVDAELNLSYICLSPFIPNYNSLYSKVGNDNLVTMYNYIDNYENDTFNYLNFYLSFLPKIPKLLEDEYIRDVFQIDGKPNYLIFKFNKTVKEIFPDLFKSIKNKSKEIDTRDNEYVFIINILNFEVIDMIRNLALQISNKKNELLKENNKYQQEVDKTEAKGLIPEIFGDEKVEKDIYGNYIKKESATSMVNKTRNNKISINRRKIEKNNKKIKNLGDIDLILTKKENLSDVFYFSGGELILLYYIYRLIQISKQEKDIILLIDELELHIHPNWQKKFLLLLFKIFSNANYKRQFIISSHSPFIISDLPKENIIFLNKGKQDKDLQKQTFGANIHTLLSDSFFMENGLMGEFAKGKINEIIDFHKKVEKANKKEAFKAEYLKKQNKFWQTQSIIGEAYLKQIVENHLIEIEKILLGKDGARESKKARLLSQLKELDND